MASNPQPKINNQSTRRASAQPVDSFVAPTVPKINCSLRRANATTGESSSPLAADSISDRVRMICERVPPVCGSVIAKTGRGMVCVICETPHTVARYRYNYNPTNRAARIAAGFCGECGAMRDSTSSRLCSRHMAMKANRKRRYMERLRHASLDTLYSTATSGHADGSATPTYDLREETADIVL